MTKALEFHPICVFFYVELVVYSRFFETKLIPAPPPNAVNSPTLRVCTYVSVSVCV